MLGEMKNINTLCLAVNFENLNVSTFEKMLISGVDGVNLPSFDIHYMLWPKSYGTHVDCMQLLLITECQFISIDRIKDTGKL